MIIYLCLRPIWLILPVVICFFQGLSHANVSGLETTREDCVRLIKRLMVYPTECGFGRTYGIPAGNPQLIPGRRILQHSTCRGEAFGTCWRMLLAGTKMNAYHWAVGIVDAGQCSGSILWMRCWTNSPPIRQKAL